jgi:hypothetical protein
MQAGGRSTERSDQWLAEVKWIVNERSGGSDKVGFETVQETNVVAMKEIIAAASFTLEPITK